MTETVKWEPAPRTFMRKDEAYALTALMAVAWPNARLTPEAVRSFWVPRLEECDAGTAREALELLIESEKEFAPSWGKFKETYLGVLKRRNDERPKQLQLGVAPARPEVAAMWRDKIRDQLGEAKGPLVSHLAAKLRLPSDVRRPDSDYFEDGPDAVETSATDNASQP